MVPRLPLESNDRSPSRLQRSKVRPLISNILRCSAHLYCYKCVASTHRSGRYGHTMTSTTHSMEGAVDYLRRRMIGIPRQSKELHAEYSILVLACKNVGGASFSPCGVVDADAARLHEVRHARRDPTGLFLCVADVVESYHNPRIFSST